MPADFPPLPRIALTLGDVAGIGPEVVVRAWQEPALHESCRPIVVGHPEVVRRAVKLVGADLEVETVDRIDPVFNAATTILCWNPSDDQAAHVPSGCNDRRAGQAACEYLSAAAAAALDRRIDGITTAPLSKAALHLAGLHYPGHTEILAELCAVRDFAMMLYLTGIRRGNPVSGNASDSQPSGGHALGVAHVTLHTSLRGVPDLLSTQGIQAKILLLDHFLRDVGCGAPRIGVCALNPHAGEAGLFGEEESRVIAPAVSAAAAHGLTVAGPLPADTLLMRACSGEFDGVVAMYHDQGHIALKLVGFHRAVNITLGLPIVRTSPSHGTAFDIAWKGIARGEGFLEATLLAARLAAGRFRGSPATEKANLNARAAEVKKVRTPVQTDPRHG